MTVTTNKYSLPVACLAPELAEIVLESAAIDTRRLEQLGLALNEDQHREILILNLFFSTAAMLKACAAHATPASDLIEAFYREVYDRAFPTAAERSPFTDRFLDRWHDYRDFLVNGSEESIRARVRTLENNLATRQGDALLYLTMALSRRTSSLGQALNRCFWRLDPVAA